MPELPEVETIRRSLEPRLLGARFRGLDPLSPAHWRNAYKLPLPYGESVEKLSRHGKYLLLHLESLVLLIHFRMTGKLIFRSDEDAEVLRHTRWITYWEKKDESWRLDFQDTRGFGGASLLPKASYRNHASLQRLGADALTDAYETAVLARYAKTQRRRSTVKGLLLDQSFLAGIGNIYADEALFRAGIRPSRPCGRISLRRLEKLIGLIRPLLEEAIGLGGTSFRDYVDSFGRRGVFALKLNVYQRTGLPCPLCGAKIRRSRVAGRTTHYCPHCQT